MFPSYLEVEKTGSQLFQACQTMLQLFGDREKWIPAILDQNMQFTTVRIKEKDYDIYLKSEKVVHSNQKNKKIFACYLEVQKTGSQLFRV